MYPENSGNDYEIIDRCGCVLIRGRVPMRKMFALIECCPHGTQFADIDTAYMASADFVAGRPQDIYQLRQELKSESMRRLKAFLQDISDRLSQEAMEWLAWGNKCASSASAFYISTGIMPPAYQSSLIYNEPYHPKNSADIHRFIILESEVPEVREKLENIRESSKGWCAVVSNKPMFVSLLRNSNDNNEPWILDNKEIDKVLEVTL